MHVERGREVATPSTGSSGDAEPSSTADLALAVVSLFAGVAGMLFGLVVATAPVALVLGAIAVLTASPRRRRRYGGVARLASLAGAILGIAAIGFGLVGLFVNSSAVQIDGNVTELDIK
jgi:hypothetical protein